MIAAMPTEHYTGITLEGEFLDFYELVDGIYRMTGLKDDYNDPYWSVKNRLLGVCYDIRHAYQGDRDVTMVENGVTEEWMKWHRMVLPAENVHVSVNLLFPEAVFVALAVPEIYAFSRRYYLGKGDEDIDFPVHKAQYADYLRDRAMLNMLCVSILDALADVIGDDALEKVMRPFENGYHFIFQDYAAQYIDKCNVDYLKTAFEKRPDKLRNMVNRIIKKPAGYQNMKRDLMMVAKEQGCSFHELHDQTLEYPEEVEW